MADGCRWIPHNRVRTAPPIPIHLFKHISSDGELHKDKGGRRTTKAHKDCPCKQVFFSASTSSSFVLQLLLLTPVQSTPGHSPLSASRSSSLYLCFPRLLIVSLPSYCLPLLSINLSNKLGSPQLRDRCVAFSAPLIHSRFFRWLLPFKDGIICCKVNCARSIFWSPLPSHCDTAPPVNCGSGEVCLTSFQGHAPLGPFSPLKGHIISQPPTSH